MNVDISESKHERMIDGIMVQTDVAELISCNTLKVEVGTTGYKGGDSGHGCRTYLRIESLSASDMTTHAICDNYGHALAEIKMGGDTELSTLVGALEFAVEKLKKFTGDVIMTEEESRERRFTEYINDLVLLYTTTGKLNGMEKVRERYHIKGITKQQFFECGLHKADGYIPADFCNRVREYTKGKTKEVPEW